MKRTVDTRTANMFVADDVVERRVVPFPVIAKQPKVAKDPSRTTALEFIALGVAFSPHAGKVQVRGPKGDEALRERLRTEIGKRDPDARVSIARVGECQSCGDELPAYRGGQCWLCICAKQKRMS